MVDENTAAGQVPYTGEHRYKALYEAMVDHLDTLYRWAEARGITLPDTDTPGSEVAGYVVVSTTGDGSYVEFDGRVWENCENMPQVRGEVRDGRFRACRNAVVVLLPEEA